VLLFGAIGGRRRGSINTPSRLVLLNTEQVTKDDTAPARTTFRFDPREPAHSEVVYLDFGLGGHEPSHEEASFAPFYPDPTQRVLAVRFRDGQSLVVVKIEALLRLAKERGCVDLRWREWKSCFVGVKYENPCRPWVSGHRLFRLYGFREKAIDVYDFSVSKSVRYTEKTIGRSAQKFASPNVTHDLQPWGDFVLGFSGTGHDSIVTVKVRTLLGSNRKSTQSLHLRTTHGVKKPVSGVCSTCGTSDGFHLV
jgi:hypothetical protein